MSSKKGNPEYGTETLEVISSAKNFNRWMYDVIKVHCSGEILEIGSGIGNISEFFIKDGYDISLSDFDNVYLNRLKNQYAHFSNLKGTFMIDFAEPELTNKHPELINRFDTVFALNVLEHVEDHKKALENAHKLLKKGGKLVLLVPAFQLLFNGFDVQLEHKRRYTRKNLQQVVERSGFKVCHSRYFNFVAILGWIFSGSLLKKKIIPDGQMKLYDKFVPVWKIIDVIMNRIMGVSIVQVAVKENADDFPVKSEVYNK